MKTRLYIPASRFPNLAHLPPDEAKELLERCLETPEAKTISRRCDLWNNAGCLSAFGAMLAIVLTVRGWGAFLGCVIVVAGVYGWFGVIGSVDNLRLTTLVRDLIEVELRKATEEDGEKGEVK